MLTFLPFGFNYANANWANLTIQGQNFSVAFPKNSVVSSLLIHIYVLKCLNFHVYPTNILNNIWALERLN